MTLWGQIATSTDLIRHIEFNLDRNNAASKTDLQRKRERQKNLLLASLKERLAAANNHCAAVANVSYDDFCSFQHRDYGRATTEKFIMFTKQMNIRTEEKRERRRTWCQEFLWRRAKRNCTAQSDL